VNNITNILLVEDDPNLGGLLKEFLLVKNYSVVLACDGMEGLRSFNSEKFDICILDVMLPQMDGFSLAKEIRKVNKSIPIIFLTAKSQHEDKIEGFKIGADDYITKPFSMEELLYRISAILKRVDGISDEIRDKNVDIGKYSYNFFKRSLIINNKVIKLTSKENQLLNLLVMSKGDIVTRTEALIKIWKSDSYFNSRSMDVYITKLRTHLKNDEKIEIVNVHGEGFKLID